MPGFKVSRLIFACSVIWAAASPNSIAGSSQLKPVLKAIDPSQAKMDLSNQSPPPPPSPNPTGSVKGKPISQPTAKRPSQSQTPQGGSYPTQEGGYPAQGGGYSPQGGGYPPQGGGYPPQGGGYPPQGGGYPPQGGGYSPQGGGYSPQGGGYPPQGGGYSPQGGGYPPQGGGYPPQGGGYPPQGGGYPPQGGGYSPQGGGYPAQGVPPPPQQSSFPNENMIPDFGQPLPPVQATPSYPAPAGQPDFSQQGFTTYRAPDSAAPATPLTPARTYAPPGRQPSASNASIESRIVRLEQLAFGSTYPEHELDDRVDHLDSEVFGKSGTGDLSSRLAKLEGKLGGQGAFGQGGQPAPSPIVATSWGPDTIQGGQPSPYSTANSGSSYDSKSQRSAPSGYSAPQPVAPTRDRSVSGQRQVAIAKPQELVPPYGATTSSASGLFDFQSTVNAIPYDSRAGDYFPQIRKGPNGSVARWTKFPIRVHLPAGSPQSWQSSLESGVKKWSQYVPIIIAGSNEAADIEVVWINHLPPNELGITRVQVQRGVLQSVIYLLRPTYYLPDVPERALAGVFLHEMGHGLGIFGHSDFKDDLMQPIEIGMVGRKRGENAKYKFGNITPRDVNTLKHIYQTPTVPPDFTSPQPTDWTLKSASK